MKLLIAITIVAWLAVLGAVFLPKKDGAREKRGEPETGPAPKGD